MKISSRYVQKWGFGLNFFGGGYTLAAGGVFGITSFNSGSFEIRTENLKIFLGAAAPRPPQLITLPHPSILFDS